MSEQTQQLLLTTLAMLLILEGCVPFLSPGGWRKIVMQVSLLSDRQLRMIGLLSMGLGLSLMYWLK